MRLVGVVAVALASLAVAEAAPAASPTLLSVGQQDRHPTATFAMPGADDATIAFATAPDRATDGRFLDENVKHLDLLTADEIHLGGWLDSEQLDPGTYYVLLNATDYDCLGDPGCINGFSNMLSLTVPKPSQAFAGRVRAYRYLSTVDLTLTVTPLGQDLPYRVCWPRARKPRRCVRSTVDGYSWNESATNSVEVRKSGMRKRTTFVWYVDGRKVATKRVRIPGSR
ncbi:MAG: hypothetical protein LT070_07545 [Solirubrobacteraceae bacterium]|nr:hypothetical protein [Solirubrobacteraceae bacterium]